MEGKINARFVWGIERIFLAKESNSYGEFYCRRL